MGDRNDKNQNRYEKTCESNNSIVVFLTVQFQENITQKNLRVKDMVAVFCLTPQHNLHHFNLTMMIMRMMIMMMMMMVMMII